VLIRDAIPTDLEAVTAIYNSIVLSSTAIYNDQPVSLDDRIAWWQARVAQGYPLLVAVDGTGTLLGYATFGDFRSWPGYRFTVEGTIHIDTTVRNQGIGTQLLSELVARARMLGKHMLIAGVDSGNTASLRFLERFGFVSGGVLREVGFKFGRRLDLCFLQYRL
jgi:L-amino acid N-acyltransferase YncA